jgi:RluA family pseudouridine synthase
MTTHRPPHRIESFPAPSGGGRLDRILVSALGCGRRHARELIDGGRVLVDGVRRPKATQPAAGSIITVLPPLEDETSHRTPLQPEVVWSGDGLIALAKPAGLHSVHGRSSATVALYVAGHFPAAVTAGQSAAECGLVHRLDRDTSGILLGATDPHTYERVRAMFRRRQVTKTYLALVEGEVDSSFTIDLPLARRRARVVAAGPNDRALPASTRIRPLDGSADWSLVEATTKSGVAHQIRAHLALASHPIIGDQKYGGQPAPPESRDGQLLHALRVILPDLLDVAAPIPADFVRAYARLATRR